jgi:hypothetical protein
MADAAGTNTEQFGAVSVSAIIAYSTPGNMVQGATTATLAAPTTLIPATPGQKIYVTGLQFGNTSSTTVTVLLNDQAASDFIIPAGGGSNSHYLIPLVVPSGTALIFTPSGGVATVFANAQGYLGL